MAAPAQKGEQLLIQAPPAFEGYEVQGGSWEEDDAVVAVEFQGGDETTINYSFKNPGRNAKCTLATVGADAAMVAVGDVLSETGSDRKWLVLTAKRKGFGTGILMQDVSLVQRDSLDLG